MRYRSILVAMAMTCGLACTGPVAARRAPYEPPHHNQPPPTVGTSMMESGGFADLGISTECDRAPD